MNISISGRSGSGKSEIAAYLERKYNYTILRPGSFCRDISNIVFGDEHKTNLEKIDKAIRRFDQNIWIEIALRNIAHGERDNLVIDGTRYYENYELLKPMGFKFWLVSGDANLNLTRMEIRGQSFDSRRILKADGETEFEKIPFDAVISNTKKVAYLFRQVEELL